VNDDDDDADDFDEGESARQEARAVCVASSSPLMIAAAAKPLSVWSAHPSSVDEPCSTRALASRARDDGGIINAGSSPQKEAKDKQDNENDDDDDNVENRPTRVVDCASSSSAEHRAVSREDGRRARSGQHPLSLVEQYVRSYALNLPSPSGKAHRKKASGRTPPPQPRTHHQRSATRRGGGTPPAGLSPSTLKRSGDPRSNITTSSPARNERRRLRADAPSKPMATSPASSSTSSAAAAAALTGGPWADSPRSHHPVMLRCLNAPSVTAAELWEQAHDVDHRTTAATDKSSTAAPHHRHHVPTAASPRRHGSSSHGGTAAHFHEMDPATVGLLGDRKRYRVDVGVDDTTANDESAAPLAVSSSYSIRIVHELTGRVGTTIPVATLVAKATSPSHQLDRDDNDDASDEPSEKRRKVMPPPFMGDDLAPEDPPGSCPLHSALSGMCSAVKKAKGAVLLLSRGARRQQEPRRQQPRQQRQNPSCSGPNGDGSSKQTTNN
jgi:hypothetical protein